MVQLPVPSFSISKPWGNLPQAAGYLSVMSRKNNLDKEIDIEILNLRRANLGADVRIIDYIVYKSVDVLYFSMYSWNSLAARTSSNDPGQY